MRNKDLKYGDIRIKTVGYERFGGGLVWESRAVFGQGPDLAVGIGMSSKSIVESRSEALQNLNRTIKAEAYENEAIKR